MNKINHKSGSIEHLVQHASDEWFQVRCGTPTASRFSDILTPAKLSLSSKSKTYARKLAAEKALGYPVIEFQGNAATERGNQLEAEALEVFNWVYEDRGIQMRESGFFVHESGQFGATPDGVYVCDEFSCGLEIKCPGASKHTGYVEEGVLPRDYLLQVQGNLLATGFDFWYFMSYYPGLSPLIVKVEKDEEVFNKLIAALSDFNQNVNSIVNKIKLKG